MVSVNLHDELWRAMQFARAVEPQLRELELSNRVQWGLARVEFIEGGYVPRVDGPSMALIVPVVEFGDTIDLAAIDLGTAELPSKRVATRLGLGSALGLDVIDRCRWEGRSLRLAADALRWLRAPVDVACILDWRVAGFRLAGLGKIVCETVELGERVETAFAHPIKLPLIAVAS
jgi:hypothetical protein